MASQTINKRIRKQYNIKNDFYKHNNDYSIEQERKLKRSIDFSNEHLRQLPRIKDAEANNYIKLYLKRKFEECKSEENLLKVRQKDRELAVFEYNKFFKKRKDEVSEKVGSLYNISPERESEVYVYK